MSAIGKETWEAGKFYEPYVGRWSRLVARQFLGWLQPGPDLDWLDVGCGTGALTEAILLNARPRHVTGIDASAGFLGYAKSCITDPRASFAVATAESLPAASARFDAVVSGLVLNFLPDPLSVVRQMARAARPHGLVAAYVWDYGGKMELMRYFWDAAAALDPSARELDEGRRFPLCAPGPLKALFDEAGLEDVDVQPIDTFTPFRDFDDYWRPFLGGQGPAPGYAMSLAPAERDALRERLRAALPMSPNGAIELVARAWAVRGKTPGAPEGGSA